MQSRIPTGFTAHGTREMVLTSTGQAAGEAERQYRRLAADLGVRPDAPSLRRDDLTPAERAYAQFMAGMGVDRPASLRR